MVKKIHVSGYDRKPPKKDKRDPIIRAGERIDKGLKKAAKKFDK